MATTFTNAAARRIAKAVRIVERSRGGGGLRRAYGDVQSLGGSFAFECVINRDGAVVLSAGYRCVIDSDWSLVAETNLGAAVNLSVVYMVYTYTTDDVAGAWSIGYGAPPAQDATRAVVRIASTYTNALGRLAIRQEHFGNVVVFDLGDC